MTLFDKLKPDSRSARMDCNDRSALVHRLFDFRDSLCKDCPHKCVTSHRTMDISEHAENGLRVHASLGAQTTLMDTLMSSSPPHGFAEARTNLLNSSVQG